MTKKIIAAVILLALFCAEGLAESIKIDSEHFPDSNFRAAIQREFDEDGDGYLSDSERDAAEVLYADNCNIASIKGIEFLPKLVALGIGMNPITEIDLSGNPNLTFLSTTDTNIITLDISGCPVLAEGASKGLLEKAGDEVHWSSVDLMVDSKTTVICNGQKLYIPEILPFIFVNPFENLFEDGYEPARYTGDVTIKEAKTYADERLTQPVGTIPAYTAVLVDTVSITADEDETWTVAKSAYHWSEFCYIVNYGDTPVYVEPSALWGNLAISPFWTYTTFPKGKTLYQRPDPSSMSTELDQESATAIITERDGWYLACVDRGDIDPYFFVPAQ